MNWQSHWDYDPEIDGLPDEEYLAQDLLDFARTLETMDCNPHLWDLLLDEITLHANTA